MNVAPYRKVLYTSTHLDTIQSHPITFMGCIASTYSLRCCIHLWCIIVRPLPCSCIGTGAHLSVKTYYGHQINITYFSKVIIGDSYFCRLTFYCLIIKGILNLADNELDIEEIYLIWKMLVALLELHSGRDICKTAVTYYIAVRIFSCTVCNLYSFVFIKVWLL